MVKIILSPKIILKYKNNTHLTKNKNVFLL